MVDTSAAIQDRRLQEDYDAADDGMSGRSRYTYRSEVDADLFLKRIGGRAFNALSDTYFLPSDDDEWVRLNKQHVGLVLALGELYPAGEEVRAILAPVPGQTKRILDLGCGTGVWTMDMAREFPHAEVVGVDLAPVPIDPETLPPNCRFEIDDINLGLDHLKDTFDVVHVRFVGSGLKDFKKTMDDASRCLKPGGIALWIEADWNTYAEDQRVCIPLALEEDEENPDQGERSWFQRIVFEMGRGMRMGNSDLDGMFKAMDYGLWDNKWIDPETCGMSSLYLPIGPWARGKSHMDTQRLGYVGALMRQDFMRVHRAGHPVMKRLGWEAEKLEKWSELADKQMMDMSPKTWFRVSYAWGRRRAAENEPAPPLPQLASSTTTEADSGHPYPHYYVYATQQEALSAAALRNRSKDCDPPPLPRPRAAEPEPVTADVDQGQESTSAVD